jgi:hypothetical protein
MNKLKIAYWVVAILFSFMMLFSGFNFLLNTSEVAELFKGFGYPEFLIYPLGIAKILGVIAIITRLYHPLKELAFAGFFFDFVLATVAHLMAADGMFMMPVFALLLLFGTYYLDKRVFEGY